MTAVLRSPTKIATVVIAAAAVQVVVQCCLYLKSWLR